MCWMTVFRGEGCVRRAVEAVAEHEQSNGHSWGIAVAADGVLRRSRGVGRCPPGLAELYPDAEVALAHTRFATRGDVTTPNAHPFVIRDEDGEAVAALAHNGTWYGAPNGDRCDSYYIARTLEARYRATPEADFGDLVRAVGEFTGETLAVIHRDGRGWAYAGRFPITRNGYDIPDGISAVRSSGGIGIRPGSVVGV